MEPRGSVSWSRRLTNLFLQGGCLTDSGPGQDPGVGETRPQQTAHDEEEEDGSDDGDGEGQLAGQEGTARKKEGQRDEQISQKLPGAQATALGRGSHPCDYHHFLEGSLFLRQRYSP